MEEKASILIADDDGNVCRILTLIFGKKGYETETAETGREAIKKARERSFNAALLDIRLPDMGGIELLTTLKEMQPNMVVMMITTYASLENAVQALNEGASAYIPKPLNMDEVLATVRNALDKQRLIGEKRRAEDALRESEENYRELADSITDIFFAMDKDLRYTYWNRASEELTGIKAEDALGKSIFEIFPDREDTRRAVAVYRDVLRTRQPRSFVSEYTLHNRTYFFEINAYPTKYGLAVLTKDATERKQAENELRVRDCAIASSINAITITDLELNLTYINNSFLELWGYEGNKEVLGKPATEFWRARRSASEIIDILRDRGSWIGELVARRKDGSLFDVQVWASIVRSEAGKPICIMASFIDITERKRSEEQLQETNRLLLEANRLLQENQQELIQSEKMASIGQLSAGVAHEINNPIGFIMGNLRALKEYVETFKTLFEQYDELSASIQNRDLAIQKAVLERIERIREQEDLSYILEDIDGVLSESLEGTERIHEVVRNLGSFARADEAQVDQANINNCIESTLKVVGNELKNRCTVNKHLNPLPLIRCYPRQLNQVFMNLLVNAAHAIPERGEITITTEATDSHIVIKISDTGVGIPSEDLSQIFDPFFTTKDASKGTGLGLPISQRIIKKHGGTIKVESQVGKGTTFTIRLPVEGLPDS